MRNLKYEIVGQNFAVETEGFIAETLPYSITVGLISSLRGNYVILASKADNIFVQSPVTNLPLLASKRITHLKNSAPFGGRV